MVFFICSHCGASLKKNKVEKHYTVQCRNAPQVSCMDCLKEFRGNDYVAHTKCITEDEKYSAKGFVPKPNSNKGECKQQEWLDVVRGVQSQGDLPKYLKTILDNIVKFENVPRKKPKFMNFLKSNNVKLGPKDIDQLWDLLEKEHKRVKENAGQSIPNKAAEMKSEDSTSNVDNDSNKQNGDVSMEADQECEATPKDKSRKKKKKSKGEVTGISETQADESSQAVETQHETSMDLDQECEDTPKSKAKKEKNKTEAVSVIENQENENKQAAEAINEASTIEVEKECEGTPKEKTKKRKSRKENKTEVMSDTEMPEGEQVPEEQNQNTSVAASNESRTTAKSKTKEDKSEIGTEIVDDSKRQVPEGMNINVPLTKKQRKEKKKREKYEAELKEVENTQFNSLPLEDDEQNKKKKKSKKDKDVNGLDSNVNGVTGEQTEEISTKPKKKRHLEVEQSAEPLKKKKTQPEGDQQIEELCTAECVTTENTNGLRKFQWNETILEIVRSKGGEIPVKRLRKKVVAEYQNCCGSAENEEQLIIKFNKKLPKVAGITLHKEVVKLMQ